MSLHEMKVQMSWETFQRRKAPCSREPSPDLRNSKDKTSDQGFLRLLQENLQAENKQENLWVENKEENHQAENHEENHQAENQLENLQVENQSQLENRNHKEQVEKDQNHQKKVEKDQDH